MLYFSLGLSSVLLLLANLYACKSKQPLMRILEISIVFALVSMGVCMFILPPVLLQAVALFTLGCIWTRKHWRPRTFILLFCSATMGIYIVLGTIALWNTERLQERYAYISLKDRLPSPPISHAEAPLPQATRHRLTQLEDRFEKDTNTWMSNLRAETLRALHEDTIAIFVKQPGFGFTRMSTVEWLLSTVHRGVPIQQPGTPNPSPWVSPPNQNQSQTADDLRSLQEASLLDFANPVNFGFIKDREHVAGFQSHHISEIPRSLERWALQRLDLMGLVLHKEPVAYVSDNLPRMDELRAAPTRSLDDFERAGLAALRSGEDLFLSQQGTECRMLGAIRAVRQCLSCHDGERGDLLGAFSYRLTNERKE